MTCNNKNSQQPISARYCVRARTRRTDMGKATLDNGRKTRILKMPVLHPLLYLRPQRTPHMESVIWATIMPLALLAKSQYPAALSIGTNAHRTLGMWPGSPWICEETRMGKKFSEEQTIFTSKELSKHQCHASKPLPLIGKCTSQSSRLALDQHWWT